MQVLEKQQQQRFEAAQDEASCFHSVPEPPPAAEEEEQEGGRLMQEVLQNKDARKSNPLDGGAHTMSATSTSQDNDEGTNFTSPIISTTAREASPTPTITPANMLVEAEPFNGCLPPEAADTTTNYSEPLRYELLKGLWVSIEAPIVSTKKTAAGTELTIRANQVALGGGLFVGDGLNLKAILPFEGNNGKARTIKDLQVSLENLAVDPRADRDEVAAFRDFFGCGSNEVRGGQQQQQPQKPNSSSIHSPSDCMSQEQLGELKNNERADNQVGEQNPMEEDIQMPLARVRAVRCRIANKKGSVDFPECQGNEGCTLRTVLEYYSQAVLNEMDLLSGRKADHLRTRTVVSDVTSVGGSCVGAAVGGLFLGPPGFLAGSFIGSYYGRKHVGATAGLMLFGPVGLVAGACVGPSTRKPQAPEAHNLPPDASASASRNLGDLAKSHIQENKYEYAGSTGVIAGAAAGSVLGPLGTIAGAFAGAVSSRMIVDRASGTSSENAEARSNQACTTELSERPYRFGDRARTVVARGKEGRGADADQRYRFGDFSRGLFGGRK